MQRTNLVRVFMADGVQLADPSPTASVQDAVRILASSGRPDLATAEIRGPEVKAGRSVYTLHRAVGTKGASPATVATMMKRLQAFDRIRGLDLRLVQEQSDCAKAFAPLLSNKPAKEGTQQLTLPATCLPCLG